MNEAREERRGEEGKEKASGIRYFFEFHCLHAPNCGNLNSN